MTAREAPPPIMQNMMISLSTYCETHQLMLWCALRRFAAVDQVRSGSSNRVLDDISEEGCKDETDKEAQDRHMYLMTSRPEKKRPQNQNQERYTASISE